MSGSLKAMARCAETGFRFKEYAASMELLIKNVFPLY
jgi:hypothetical protein